MGIKKFCFSICVFLMGTQSYITGSEAATFHFSGLADFRTEVIASLFGQTDTTGTFSATLEFDDTQMPGDAVSTVDFPSNAASDYNFISFAWSMGNRSWSHVVGGGASLSDFVVIGNGKDNTRNDGVTIFSTRNVALTGFTVRQSQILNQDLPFTTFGNTNAANIGFFSLLTNDGLGFIQIVPGGTNDIERIELSRVTLDLNPVPLPAGIWLFGAAILSFIGIRRRRS